MRTQSPETLSYASKEECILLFLATGEKTSLGQDIQSAYITWQNLPSSFKWEMDGKAKNSKSGKSYTSLIRSFLHWDQTQDNDGAPGWYVKESSINEVVKHVGEDLLSLLHTLEEIWENRKREFFKTRVETEKG
ncbi:uncharacterized protein TNIN_59831 [Trichonephila inaurata madagascariensis]|uniref:Uncharacterized protein n=1 Tax=Trichonephila inaurata madagascariensis TaxID=2747483 RepID=A0A8X7C5V7_9ARAC|nr:uncharacterized protein TNIN_59831 [Trichonephila inaurata madagascariensis]